MSKFSILVAVLSLGCATGATRSRAPMTADALRTVTGLGMSTTGELPTRYGRLSDHPGAKYLIWSYERMCLVDAQRWMQTRIGDAVSCTWRSPR